MKALFIVSLLASSGSAFAQDDIDLPSLIDQINSLYSDPCPPEEELTDADKKLGSNILYLIYCRDSDDTSPRLEPVFNFDETGRLLIDIRAEVAAGLIDAIEAGGGDVISQNPRYDAIRALLPLDSIVALAERTEIRTIRHAEMPFTR